MSIKSKYLLHGAENILLKTQAAEGDLSACSPAPKKNEKGEIKLTHFGITGASL